MKILSYFSIKMATHSSVLAWRIPGTGEPGGLPSLGLHRVGYDWSDLAAAAAVKAMVFPVVMYRCESWPIKKVKHQKNWCFQTVVLEKTLENPLDCNKIKPVNPKGNQPWLYWKNWCWSWGSNTLSNWYEVSTHWKILWCWQRLKAGGEEGDRK